ncbi:arylsulfatase [Flavobacterium sp. LHD-80]|uniref:arylsulfatase n=1 Tax=Flavobacterium sp. LHD-80 TaxID=3071411 RepID=UPI0027DEF23C|nr:arylsulfatase [Flavobacterium sp. LHD-80]MDQ6473099.1 arylsulfatase [Flavobacterium sp. LHD-80]
MKTSFTVIRYLVALFLIFSLFLQCNKKTENVKSDNQESIINGDTLPFSEPKSASTYGESILDSKHIRRQTPSHLPEDSPNVVIILMDDVGFGIPSTFGGEVNTPTLTKVYNEGIAYNRFHTTSICSPTRASLLTGRNHTRIGSGTIAERAVDWDGYTGIIPKEAATMAEILKNYGYSTSAFGKWHNTPANQTSTAGPFDYWPINYGFQHFYGFLGGETSQWEPALINDFTPIEAPKKKDYHLSTDLADQTIDWIKKQKALAPDKPFFVYLAPGAGHGPQHIFKEWADKYKGKFNDGWDAYRERVFKRQKEMGWIPKNTKLTARHQTQASWESIPKEERAFQVRLMEVFAGFVEHADTQVGRVIDVIDEIGEKDNTIVIYIWGDNGSSAEGQNGSISELLAQNGIKNTIQQQINALKKIGGLDALGGKITENMYHSSWAWAGNTPFKYTKLIGSHFGGTRNPMVIRWPKKIKHDTKPRSQFHHVNDIAPTIYDLLHISLPKVVNGFKQMPMDGISMAYTFDNADVKSTPKTQFFDNNGSRGIYKDGWYACTFGPLYPWLPGAPGLDEWDPKKDKWELYNINNDFSQFYDLAAKNPEKLKELQGIFMEQAEDNKDLPIGAGIWLRLHPEDVISSPYRSWNFTQNTRRIPEFSAPGVGKTSNKVSIDIEIPANANGVLYAVGGSGGGLTCFIENNKLTYEYNMFLIENYSVTTNKIAPGRHTIEIITKMAKPGAAATVTINIDGKQEALCNVKRTVPAAFSATETFDVGTDMGGAVSLRYHNKAPFEYDGKIYSVKINLMKGN